METLRNLKNLDKDDLLDALGLQARRGPMDNLPPALGLFGAGLVVGAALGLLLAPKPGRTLRRQLSKRAGEAYERASEAVDDIRTRQV